MKDLIVTTACVIILLVLMIQFGNNQAVYNKMSYVEKNIENFKEIAKQEGCLTTSNMDNLKTNISNRLEIPRDDIKITGTFDLQPIGAPIYYCVETPINNIFLSHEFFGMTDEENSFISVVDKVAVSEYIVEKDPTGVPFPPNPGDPPVVEDPIITVKINTDDEYMMENTENIVETWNIGSPVLTDVIAILDTNGELQIMGEGDTIYPNTYFKNNSNIKFVNFENTVTPLNMNSWFENCVNLFETTRIPNSVISMYDTFYNCTSIKTAPKLGTDVTNLEGTFAYCTALDSAPVIPNTVTNIAYTFYHCYSLKTAPIIPNNVTNMMQTFNSCNSLTTAPIIPSSVTNLISTFNSCSLLTDIPTLPNSMVDMTFTFNNCTSLVIAPAIPNSIINMDSTFAYCTSLTTASIIPNSVTNMKKAFYNCTSLIAPPTIPSSVTNLNYTFYNCNF